LDLILKRHVPSLPGPVFVWREREKVGVEGAVNIELDRRKASGWVEIVALIKPTS
jgi:hypothetical protein